MRKNYYHNSHYNKLGVGWRRLGPFATKYFTIKEMGMPKLPKIVPT